jgi:Tol biopolymer transport system component
MPARGGPARQLTSRPGRASYPSWSPDGRELAFKVTGREGSDTWIVGANGGEPRFFTQGGFVDWSPGEQWLVVLRQGRLFRVAREGGEPLLLPILTSHQPDSPRFSRDGRSIYYHAIDGPPESQDVWALSLPSGQVSRRTKLGGRRGRLGYYYSADARDLYFTWTEDEGDIWVMDVATDDAR